MPKDKETNKNPENFPSQGTNTSKDQMMYNSKYYE
jgi:hypothetical protein